MSNTTRAVESIRLGNQLAGFIEASASKSAGQKMTALAFMILNYLEAKGASTGREIERATGYGQATVSETLKRLVAQEYVDIPGPVARDRRTSLFELARPSRPIVSKILKSVDEQMTEEAFRLPPLLEVSVAERFVRGAAPRC